MKTAYELDDADIRAIALDCGFKLKPQPDGLEDLNPYVYKFARELLSTIPRPEDVAALREQLTPSSREGLDPRVARDFAHTLRNYLFAFNGQEFSPATDSIDRQNLAQALDHLEEAAAMILNLSERVSLPAQEESVAYVVSVRKSIGQATIELNDNCNLKSNDALYTRPDNSGLRKAAEELFIAKDLLSFNLAMDNLRAALEKS